MKLTWPWQQMALILEGSPEEFSRFLMLLDIESSKELPRPSFLAAKENTPGSRPEVKARMHESEAAAKGQSVHGASRFREKGHTPTRGRPKNPSSRRGQVLEVMKALWRQGKTECSLVEIQKVFQQQFPQTDQTHLDQVIRDLANKTSELVRVKRGYFSLAQHQDS
jgi:hypothetical protein